MELISETKRPAHSLCLSVRYYLAILALTTGRTYADPFLLPHHAANQRARSTATPRFRSFRSPPVLVSLLLWKNAEPRSADEKDSSEKQETAKEETTITTTRVTGIPLQPVYSCPTWPLGVTALYRVLISVILHQVWARKRWKRSWKVRLVVFVKYSNNGRGNSWKYVYGVLLDSTRPGWRREERAHISDQHSTILRSRTAISRKVVRSLVGVYSTGPSSSCQLRVRRHGFWSI